MNKRNDAHHHANLDRPVLEGTKAGAIGELLVNARMLVQKRLDVCSDGLHLWQVLIAHSD